MIIQFKKWIGLKWKNKTEKVKQLPNILGNSVTFNNVCRGFDQMVPVSHTALDKVRKT